MRRTLAGAAVGAAAVAAAVIVHLPGAATAADTTTLPAGSTTIGCQRGRISVTVQPAAVTLRCSGTGASTGPAPAVAIPAGASRRFVCSTGARPTVVSRTRSTATVRCPSPPPTATSTTTTVAPSTVGGVDYPWPSHPQPVAPDGRRICSSEVHDRFSVVIDGVRFATWHPPIDPVTGCAFGHEHGSNPSAWAHASVLDGPISFGRIGAAAGTSEAHAGFKVYAVDRDRHGLGWLVVLHQGSASPKRAQVRHHSLEVWMVNADTGQLLAHTSVMADFGDYVPNCRPDEVARLGPAFAPANSHAVAQRAIPAPQCESVYEQWVAQLDIGGFFGGTPGFDIDNAITQVDPLDPTRVVFNKRFACGPNDPAGWDSYCKGDKRNVIHPSWWLRPGSPGTFRTDVHGRRDPNGPLVQWVDPTASHQVPWSQECCGPEVVLTMNDPTTGVYQPGANPGINFEGPAYCVLRWN